MASYYDSTDSIEQPIKAKFLPTLEGTENNGTENETPIFTKSKMRLRNDLNGDIIHLTVSKNWLVCILVNGKQTTLLRLFLPRALPPVEILLDKYLFGYKITKIFFDNTGQHLLISLVPESQGLSADFLYIHGNGPKVRRIEKFKDHEITAVAFNNYVGNETSTGPILLGTSRGLIFETELSLEAEKPSFRRQVYDLGLDRPKYPITGLELLRVPNCNKYMVVATSTDFIYTFQETLKPEEKSLQAIFAPYVNGTLSHGAEECRTDLNYSVLKLYAESIDKFPKQWAWLCGTGVRVGEFSTDINSSDVILGDTLISMDFEQNKHLSYTERRAKVPKTFVLTEQHVLLLYSDHITGICILNQTKVYEEYFHENLGELLNIVRDAFTGAIYLYTEKTIFNYKITDESRNIWRIYLDKGLYDLAEQYAIESPTNIDIVLTHKANSLYSQSLFEQAALIYADTQKTFEEISLKFMEIEDKRPIIRYVSTCLSKLPDTNVEHIKVLVIWLTDLYLTQINNPQLSSDERKQWQIEFDKFFKDPRVFECARNNKESIQELFAQHADAHNLSQFAIANGDYEEVIKQQINAEKYADALLCLRKQRNMELYYKYCPIIMEHLPQETIETLMAHANKLKIERLIPTLITLESPKHIEQIIKYLEFVIYNLSETNQAVHNFLIRLYAEHKPTQLITYLENEGRDVTMVHYDVNYALSVCMEFKAQIASVFVQCLLQMWSSAVDLALSFDVQLAKNTASKPADEETRRKLWLRIAHHDIQGTNDVKKALSLLEECNLLRIEDLLPFFSDFEKIDDFKTPICKALKEYNEKMQELQHEMNECTKQAERVRSDLQNVRSRSVRVGAHELCTICETFLLMKPFFLFTCGHKFHTDCLEKQVIPMLTSERSRRLTMLKQQLDSLITQTIAMAGQSHPQQKKREKIKEEIEDILAADCLYCCLMIETIDQPFVEDWDQVNVDWD